MKKVAFVITALLVSAQAWAGEVRVLDSTGILTKDQISDLQGESKWKFDLHVLVKNDNIESSTEAAVTGPNVLAIGVDPIHHKTSVRKGSQVSSDAGRLSDLGNPYFKHSDWVGGIRAIADAAAVAVVAVRQVDQHEIGSTAEQRAFAQPDASHTLLWVILLLALGGLIVYVISRRRRSAYMGEYSVRSEHPYDLYEPVRTGYAPDHPRIAAPRSVVPPARPSQIVVGRPETSAVDLLVGMEIGKSLGETHFRDHPVSAPRSAKDDSSWGAPTLARPEEPARDDSSWSPVSVPSADDSSWGAASQAPAPTNDDSSWGSKSSSDSNDSVWSAVNDAVSSVADSSSDNSSWSSSSGGGFDSGGSSGGGGDDNSSW